MRHWLVILWALWLPWNSMAADAEHPHETADEHSQEEGIGQVIVHHLLDDYQWHFFSYGDLHATLYLPIIVYHQGHGLKVFSSRHLYHSPDHTYQGIQLHHDRLAAADGAMLLDFSISKVVVGLLLTALLLLWVFRKVARAYEKRLVPAGLQSFMEPIVLFVRDDIAVPSMGTDNARRFTPLLLTFFFFIWFANLLGLLPWGLNLTGNIAVTGALALLALIVINVNGTKDYWVHIFWTPGVPWWLKVPLPVMPLVEFLGIFTKPFALMIRLFANITAGHVLILSTVSLIFIMAKLHPLVGYGTSLFSIGLGLFLFGLELLVAILQAYIFTILVAVFIGMALETHHHEEAH